MGLFDILAVLITLAAVFSFVNFRFIKLPTTIGLMVISLLMSLGIIALHHLTPVDLTDDVRRMLEAVDFDAALLEGMLSFLLFAGALHVNLDDLLEQKAVIASLATIGLVTSTTLVGVATYYGLGVLGLDLPFLYCLVFGALISPTDPIAVIGILKTARAPRSLETKIAGESLFNDGVAVVIFLVLVRLAVGGGELDGGEIVRLFAQEALGGAGLGLVAGLLTYWMLRQVNNYQVEVLLTLALVTGGYALAMALHVSGPIAVVIAGLLIGNQGRRLAMSDTTREHLDTFWELIDEVLNAVLFVLIGLEVLLVDFSGPLAAAIGFSIVVAVLARFISVGIPVSIMAPFREFSPQAIRILTWGGLRGGISVALALSLPPSPEREIILSVTYGVVVFSILVQGLTIGPLVRRALRDGPHQGPTS